MVIIDSKETTKTQSMILIKTKMTRTSIMDKKIIIATMPQKINKIIDTITTKRHLTQNHTMMMSMLKKTIIILTTIRKLMPLISLTRIETKKLTMPQMLLEVREISQKRKMRVNIKTNSKNMTQIEIFIRKRTNLKRVMISL